MISCIFLFGLIDCFGNKDGLMDGGNFRMPLCELSAVTFADCAASVRCSYLPI